MSRTFETKNKIINLLKGGARKPSEISAQLSLSPSTVSQHLKELKEVGKLEEYQDEHFKNIKYYRITENVSIMSSRPAKFAATATAVIIIGMLIVLLGTGGTTTPISSTQNVGIFLTDPPQVPAGTQALWVSYSSFKVQITDKNGTFWEPTNTTGSVNLFSLINFTKNLTNLSIPTNSIIDRISFNITNATITVNGTVYPVLVPSKQLSVDVKDGNRSTPSDILIDLTPSVTAVIANNQTTFIMTQSGTAVPIPRKYGMHDRGQIPAPIDEGVMSILNNSRTKISIVNATITASGNRTSISIAVKDNSNSSTDLLNVMIVLGNESFAPLQNPFGQAPNKTFNTINPYPTGNHPGVPGWHNQSNTTQPSAGWPNRDGRHLNGTKFNNMSRQGPPIGFAPGLYANRIADGGLPQRGAQNPPFASDPADYMSSRQVLFKIINLFIAQNGSLSMPEIQNIGHFPPDQPKGMLLTPDSVAVLRYNGTITMADGKVGLQLRSGERYRIIVMGTGCAMASLNVTAG